LKEHRLLKERRLLKEHHLLKERPLLKEHRLLKERHLQKGLRLLMALLVLEKSLLQLKVVSLDTSYLPDLISSVRFASVFYIEHRISSYFVFKQHILRSTETFHAFVDKRTELQDSFFHS
jgi:hypothetical protein